MDGGILVISSPDGPMAQTREHILLSKQALAATGLFRIPSPPMNIDPDNGLFLEESSLPTSSNPPVKAGSMLRMVT